MQRELVFCLNPLKRFLHGVWMLVKIGMEGLNSWTGAKTVTTDSVPNLLFESSLFKAKGFSRTAGQINMNMETGMDLK